MSKVNAHLNSWGARVQSQLSTVDVKSFGRVGVLMGGKSGERDLPDVWKRRVGCIACEGYRCSCI